MALFFIYDEFTDKVDGDGARLYAEMVMDAIRNPHKERPQGEAKLGEIARQYVCEWVNVPHLSDVVPTLADFGCVRSRYPVLQPRRASSPLSPNMSSQ